MAVVVTADAMTVANVTIVVSVKTVATATSVAAAVEAMRMEMVDVWLCRPMGWPFAV